MKPFNHKAVFMFPKPFVVLTQAGGAHIGMIHGIVCSLSSKNTLID